MKAEELFDVIGDIDDSIIEDTLKSKKQMPVKSLARWGALAACFVVVAVLSLKTFEKEKSIQKEYVVENIERATDEKPKHHNEKTQTDTGKQDVNVQNADAENKTNNEYEYNSQNTDDSVTEETAREEGVTEDSVTNATPATDENVAADESPSKGGGGGGASGGGSSANSGAYREAVEADTLPVSVAKIFGGTYINGNGEYVIIITDDTPENREILIKTLGTENSKVVFRKGTYTLSYLTELQNKISTAMTKGEIPFVMTSSLMESENRIEVSANTNDESELDKVRQFDTLGGAIVFVKM